MKLQLDVIQDYTQRKLKLPSVSRVNQEVKEDKNPTGQEEATQPLPTTDPTLVQELEIENVALLDRFSRFQSDLQEIEKQLIGLRDLTNVLSEEVEHQTESLMEIGKNTEGSIQTVKRGNSTLQSVKASSSDFRLCVLVLIIFLSFSVLFLHWVND
eukprot:TRINITY_DN4482_c0_g1_i4.p2 TRINITY_DN4482_c0_g1~~TRINITY_DN4482_c0_g1_i4.p2  ORF type:complete len:156 (+),score=36.57 TRINITY_DN4482_c0_g1_i4:1161-1628(+)